DVFLGAVFDGVDRGRNGFDGRYDDNGHHTIHAHDLIQHFHTAHVRHDHVQQYDVDVVLFQRFQGGRPVLGQQDTVLIGEDQSIRLPHAEFVVDAENGFH